MLSKGINDELKDTLYNKINLLISRYLTDGVGLYDLKRFYKAKVNVVKLSNTIQSDGERLFNNKEEYIVYLTNMIKEVIDDRISEEETNKMNENKLFRYNDFINDGLLPGKSLDRIEKEMEGKSDNEKIKVFIKRQGLHKLLPRNEDGKIVYDGDLECSRNNLTSLPEDLVVNGNLSCYINNLTSLPDDLVVKGYLNCSNQKSGIELEIPKSASISGEIISK